MRSLIILGVLFITSTSMADINVSSTAFPPSPIGIRSGVAAVPGVLSSIVTS